MTEELKKEILEILDNVYYWETCPQEYNDRIDAVKKQLTIPDVVGRSEQLKCHCCDGTGIVEGESYDDKQSCLTCSGRGHFN